MPTDQSPPQEITRHESAGTVQFSGTLSIKGSSYYIDCDTFDERVAIMKFFDGYGLTEDDRAAIGKAGFDKFIEIMNRRTQ